MKNRIHISISALITFSLSFLLISFSLFSALSQLSRYDSYQLQNRNTETLMNIQDFKRAIAESQATFSDYLNTENAYKLTSYHQALSTGKTAIAVLDDLIGYGEEASFTLSSMKESYKSYISQCEKTFELFGLGREDYYQEKQKAEMIAGYLVQTNPVKMSFLNVGERFGEVGNLKYLSEAFGFTADNIVKKVEDLIR